MRDIPVRPEDMSVTRRSTGKTYVWPAEEDTSAWTPEMHQALDLLRAMTDVQRQEVRAFVCHACGAWQHPSDRCQCWNDE